MVHVLGKAKTPTAPRPKKARPAPTPAPATERAPATAEAGQPQDDLDRLAGDPLGAIELMLWLGRHQNPSLAVKITQADIDKLTACTGYLEVQPQVRIHRPPGAPAMPAVPATATRSAQPARPAEGPRPYVLVEMVDQHGNAFVPIENNEDDAQRRDLAEKVRTIKQLGPQLAARLKGSALTGDTVASDIIQVAEDFMTLIRALP